MWLFKCAACSKDLEKLNSVKVDEPLMEQGGSSCAMEFKEVEECGK